jgi:CHASE3 domain sensor protein
LATRGVDPRLVRSTSLGTLVQNILLAAEDVETGQRGFLLTDQDLYLVPFNRARTLLPMLLDELDRPCQRTREFPFCVRRPGPK